MAENLLIRLPSHEKDIVHWLIWSNDQKEIIASGELSSAEQLSVLTSKAVNRNVICIVPSCDVIQKVLTVPGKSSRAIKMAAPYMLEDELAQEVENIFFAYGTLKNHQQGGNCYLVGIAENKMQQWLHWLQQANISTKVMIPDALCLPVEPEQWSAIELGEQVLCRFNQWQSIALEKPLWSQWLAQQLEQSSDQSVVLAAYSDLPSMNEQLSVEYKSKELPLALMANHFADAPINLLQGKYKASDEQSPLMKQWLVAAGFVGVALLLAFVNKMVQLNTINQQIASTEKTLISSYKKVFPDTKRIRVATLKSQLKQKLTLSGNEQKSDNFLQIMQQIRPAFSAVPELKPSSIKFDAKRQEVRIQAVAKDYQSFERFKNGLEKQRFNVNQGALNNDDNQVSGSFTIRRRS